MIDIEPIPNANPSDSLVQKPQSLYIQSLFDSLKIELPSFDQILNIKNIGLKNIKINSLSVNYSIISELLQYEKNNILRYKDSLGDLPKYKYRLAVLYEKTGEKEKAENILKDITENDNSNFYHYKYAISLLNKDFELGINELKKINVDETYISLSLAYLQKGDLESAENNIKHAYNEFDYNSRINLIYALIEQLKGSYQQSICLLREIINLSTPSFATYYLLSMNYVLQKNVKKAYKYCVISNYLNPLNKDSLILLCQISNNLKIYKGMVHKIEQYLDYDNKDISMWSHLAIFYYNEDNNKECKNALRTLLTLDENDYSAWNNLALIAIKEHEIEKAEKYFAQAVLKSGENLFRTKVLENYFQFLFNTKQYDKLCTIYESLNINQQTMLKSHEAFKYHEYYIYSKYELHEYHAYINLLNELKSSYKQDIVLYSIILNNIICYYCNIEIDKNQEDLTIYELENLIKKNFLPRRELEKSYNNILFAYLEYNDINNSNRYIVILRDRIDNNPYFNATYGLYYFKYDNIERGEYFYNKAINLCNDNDLKNRLIRKRDLEIAKYYLNHDKKKNAKNKIEKILKESKENDFIKEQANKLKQILHF